jgi:hypothetical protein
VKLNGGDIQSVKQGNLKRGKRKPKVEGLYDDPVHQEIMRRGRVNYSYAIANIYRLYNDVALLPGTGEFDGPPKGLDAVWRMKLGLGEHRSSRRVKRHQFLPCERRTRDYYTIAITTTTTRGIAIALDNWEIKHPREILIFVK